MEDRLEELRIRNRLRGVSRRLARNNQAPHNADRALWGTLAMVTFANVAGLSGDLKVDPETALGDLLADLMHWCDVHRTNNSVTGSVDFESALRRARDHHREERR